MRNLKLKYNQRYRESIQDAICLLINPNSQKSSDCRYVVTADKLIAFVPGLKDSHKVLAEVPDIVAAEYLALDNEICLATAVGEVLLVNTENLQVNEGTFCDVGIECMAWSPDQEVVVFVTKQHHVVVMTCTYDSLAEHPLSDDSSEVEGEFVNVGWGKKETQFHGSEGKQAAKQKTDDKQNTNIEELPKVSKEKYLYTLKLEYILTIPYTTGHYHQLASGWCLLCCLLCEPISWPHL